MSVQTSRPSGIGWIAALLLVVILFLFLIHVISFTPEIIAISFALVAIALLVDRWVRVG